MTISCFLSQTTGSFGEPFFALVASDPARLPGVVALIGFLIILNALFVAAEFSLVKVHRSQLEEAASEGKKGSALALHVVSHTEAYLSACQVGITASSIVLGAIGEPYLSGILLPLFEPMGLGETAIRVIAFTSVVAALTVLNVIFGEQIPRVFGIRKTVETTILCSYPLRVFYLLMAGPVWLINKISNTLLRGIFRMDPVDNSHISHTADELRLMVEETGKAHKVTQTEHAILMNALQLSELSVRDILTPRNDVVFLDVHRTFRENLEVALESKHTRFPLVDRHLDKTLGLIHIKDVLREMQKDSPNLFALKRDLVGVSEKLPLDEMLQLFLGKRAHIALVLDEFGGSIGLVMLDDVLDQVVGEIFDEFDDEEEPGFRRVDADTFVVEGWLPLHELAQRVEGLDLEDPDVSTIGGYITSLLGRLPEPDESVTVENYVASVVKADDRTIQEIRFERIIDPEGSDENNTAASEAAEE